MQTKSDLAEVKKRVYKEKRNSYFGICRKELIDLIPRGDYKILDVGCGNASTGEMLKRTGKAREVVGIEIDVQAAQKASQKLDKVILGDIEEIELPFEKGYFDYIVCADVIEHLIDPWGTLKKLRKYLSLNGFLIASIPNVRHWSILKPLLLKKNWNYVEAGILDEGHLRFFTYNSILDLFTNSGFRVCEIFNKALNYHRNSLKVKLFNLFTFSRFSDIFTYQYIIVVAPQTKRNESLPYERTTRQWN